MITEAVDNLPGRLRMSCGVTELSPNCSQQGVCVYIHNISTKDISVGPGRNQQVLAVESAAFVAEQLNDSEFLSLFDFEPCQI